MAVGHARGSAYSALHSRHNLAYTTVANLRVVKRVDYHELAYAFERPGRTRAASAPSWSRDDSSLSVSPDRLAPLRDKVDQTSASASVAASRQPLRSNATRG